jgi:CBS domain-containing protein
VPAIWLARINAMVAIFNLIPGFPLDGGRVFRALIWRWTGSYHRATQVASLSGELVAFSFIGLGAFAAFQGNVLGGMWMILIGWFLQNAAAATYAQASLRELLRGVKVADAMTRECSRVPGDLPLERLVQEEVLGTARRCFIVTDNGRLRGLLTLHEVKAIPQDQWATVRVEEVMTRKEQLATVAPQEDLFRALEKMDDANVAQMPVVSGENLIGMLSREEVLRYLRVRAELGI